MIDIWGVCEFAEISHDPLRRWDNTCRSFEPVDTVRVDTVKICCANCKYWLIPDENPDGRKPER